MNTYTQILTTALLSLLFIFIGFVGLVHAPVYAQNNSAREACETLQVLDNNGSCVQRSGDVNINRGLRTALNLLSFVAGVIAVIMIMIAGARYITSQGDSQKVSQAKNAIIYAAIGIVIVALAQVIVRFVLGVAAT